jgi:hypothetical protein
MFSLFKACNQEELKFTILSGGLSRFYRDKSRPVRSIIISIIYALSLGVLIANAILVYLYA